MVAKKNYFSAIVAVTERYLGPASERFIRRQIEFHIEKKPDNISYADVQRLKINVGIALGLLVNDKKIVDQAITDIEAIPR